MYRDKSEKSNCFELNLYDILQPELFSQDIVVPFIVFHISTAETTAKKTQSINNFIFVSFVHRQSYRFNFSIATRFFYPFTSLYDIYKNALKFANWSVSSLIRFER